MFSINEIESLAQKAARGGGAHAGQAVHFGRVAVRHLASRRSATSLMEALAGLPGGAIQTAPIEPETCTDAELELSYREALDASAVQPDLPERLACPEPLLVLLRDLAQNTYVPNTEASRAVGAGAGLSDND